MHSNNIVLKFQSHYLKNGGARPRSKLGAKSAKNVQNLSLALASPWITFGPNYLTTKLKLDVINIP